MICMRQQDAAGASIFNKTPEENEFTKTVSTDLLKNNNVRFLYQENVG